MGNLNIIIFRGRFPCKMYDPIPSPDINGYRTKCEFTIGKDLDGKPTVGFLLGLYKLGITAVLDPKDCLNVPDIAKRIASYMQVRDYLLRLPGKSLFFFGRLCSLINMYYRIIFENRNFQFMIE